MVHGSLFSGIGGFDLAARIVGWDNAFSCEIDPFCNRVLKFHFPDETHLYDIRHTDFSLWRGRIDVLSGGFPCQPFSQAGKRKGTDDDRHLWPAMLTAIRQIRPRWVVGENVLGIVNWSDGMVFEQVCAQLEAEGYGVQPFVFPACGVDAPHRRYRTFFIAYADFGDDLREAGGHEGANRAKGLPHGDSVRKSDESNSLWRHPRTEGSHDAADPSGLFGWGVCGQKSEQQTALEVAGDTGIPQDAPAPASQYRERVGSVQPENSEPQQRESGGGDIGTTPQGTHADSDHEQPQRWDGRSGRTV